MEENGEAQGLDEEREIRSHFYVSEIRTLMDMIRGLISETDILQMYAGQNVWGPGKQ